MKATIDLFLYAHLTWLSFFHFPYLCTLRQAGFSQNISLLTEEKAVFPFHIWLQVTGIYKRAIAKNVLTLNLCRYHYKKQVLPNNNDKAKRSV